MLSEMIVDCVESGPRQHQQIPCQMKRDTVAQEAMWLKERNWLVRAASALKLATLSLVFLPVHEYQIQLTLDELK